MTSSSTKQTRRSRNNGHDHAQAQAQAQAHHTHEPNNSNDDIPRFANFDNFKQIGSSGNVLTKNGNKELFLVIV